MSKRDYNGWWIVGAIISCILLVGFIEGQAFEDCQGDEACLAAHGIK